MCHLSPPQMERRAKVCEFRWADAIMFCFALLSFAIYLIIVFQRHMIFVKDDNANCSGWELADDA